MPRKPDHPVTRYAKRVVAGKIPTSKLVLLACKRHLDDLQHGKSRGIYFSESAADHAIEFYCFLKHFKGKWSGKSFDLELWQQFIVGSLFGWIREDGTRRFRTGYIEIPRKNGKSTLIAGIGLYLMIADGEEGAEIYSAATKKEQARIVFDTAKAMVRKAPYISRMLEEYKSNLSNIDTNSKFEPLGSDYDTMDGLNPHGVLVDELHAHKTRGLWDVMDSAMGAREQPMIIAITTAGFNRLSICWEVRGIGEKVLSGTFPDDSFFAYIAGLDKDDDWKNEKNWPKANPNYGVSVNQEYLRQRYKKASHSPAAQNTFRRLHLDEWTSQSERWIDMEVWDACAHEVDEISLIGRECYSGLDLSSTQDITAEVKLFPPDVEKGEKLWRILPAFWIPKDNIQKRSLSSGVPYADWWEMGLIEATEGNVVDYDVIRAHIRDSNQIYNIQEISIDRWNSTQMQTQLMGDGFEVVQFGQGYASMSGPMKELDRLVLEKTLAHGGHPVLRWMAENMAVKTDEANNMKPDKKRSAEKIDGMVALVMALGRAIAAIQEQPSPYQNRGFIFV